MIKAIHPKIAENIAKKAKAREKLLAHCLCLKVEGDIVWLPDGYGIDGLRINETAEGFTKAELKLEEIWQESLFWK